MSLYDVSKLTGANPIRGVGREYSGSKAESKPVHSAAPADQGVAVQTGARVEAGNVPVDHDRVAEIRNALRNGSYPITPAKISDAIIAARLMLSSPQ